ncbi:MAG: hypothetical protein ABI690_27490 [Chloroflexota bacterium]
MLSIHPRRSIAIFALTLLVYGLRAGTLLQSPSLAPYFLNLADSFLHGTVNIQVPPAWGYDLIRYHDAWYVAQQPLPALLMMPVIRVLGIEHLSDVTFGVLCGALSVMLADHILQLTTPDLSVGKRNLLVIFLALGTVHFSLSVMGTVWFLGQIATILFVWVLIWAAWRGQPVLAGASLGLILLGRPSIVPGALVFAVGTWQMCHPRASWQCRIHFLTRLLIPLTVAMGFLGWYNWARFGSPLEMGYAYIQEAPDIKQRFLTHGNFSPFFLPENLFIATVKPPLIHLHCLGQLCPIFEPHPLGMGLIWTSPFLFYGLWALRQKVRERQQNILLVVSAGLALLPSLLYHNPGSAQFGYRFLLDGLPFWMILVARGVRNQPRYRLIILVIFCVIVNWWGTSWLIEFLT